MFDGILRIFGTPIESNSYAAGIIANSNEKLGKKIEAAVTMADATTAKAIVYILPRRLWTLLRSR